MQEENKTVDIDTSGPAVDVELPEEKKEEVPAKEEPKEEEGSTEVSEDKPESKE